MPAVPEGGGGKNAFGLKSIVEVMPDVMPIPADLLELAMWISAYYCAPIGMTIATMVPAAVKRGVRLPSNVMITLAEPGRSVEETLAGSGGALKLSPRAKAVFLQVHDFLKEGEKSEQDVLGARTDRAADAQAAAGWARWPWAAAGAAG